MNRMGNYIAEVYFLMAVVAVFLVRNLYRRLHRRSVLNAINGNNQPLLNAFYTKDRDIVPLNKGKFAALKYTMYMTGFTTRTHHVGGNEGVQQMSPEEEVIICCVELPFVSSTHLVGLAKNGSSTLVIRDFLEQRNLETVSLEGNFPNYAHIYVTIGDQVDARYLLDPKAMAFVADFCKTHHWEVVGKYLYFVSSDKIQGKAVADDSTPIMTEDIERFVKEIKPALSHR